jgi:hypothetical protein
VIENPQQTKYLYHELFTIELTATVTQVWTGSYRINEIYLATRRNVHVSVINGIMITGSMASVM